MTNVSDRREQRLKMYWYVALVTLPLVVALLLLNADPYERVQLNQVLQLRAQLAEKNIGSEVIDWLDHKGGHNLSEAQWYSIQSVTAEQLHFMLTSSQQSRALHQQVKAALADGYVTQAEYSSYQQQAAEQMMQPELLVKYGF